MKKQEFIQENTFKLIKAIEESKELPEIFDAVLKVAIDFGREEVLKEHKHSKELSYCGLCKKRVDVKG